MINFSQETIDSLHEKLVRKEITAQMLVETVYHHIDKSDAIVKAFINLDRERALAKAKIIDAEGVKPEETLKGIPYAAKDNMFVAGMPATAGSEMLANYYPTYTASFLQQMDAAGMILIGKTNLDEFAMGADSKASYYQITINPWDPETNPGGSSGGSAAAITSGQIPCALGSDTGGSIRQPAALQNLVGLKPTYGLVSRYGVFPSAPSMDTVGPITRTVKSNAQMLQVMAGYDENDPTSYTGPLDDFTAHIDGGVDGLVIGIVSEFQTDAIDADIQRAMQTAVHYFTEKGATVQEISLPHVLYASETYDMLNHAEGAESLAPFDGIHYGFQPGGNYASEADTIIAARTQGFGREVKRRVLNGLRATDGKLTDSYYAQATKVRRLIKNDFEQVFQKVDIILTPTLDAVAASQSDMQEHFYEDVMDKCVNLAGLPALSIPAGFKAGMPFGMQLIGRPLSEALLYRVAYSFEKGHDYSDRMPDIYVNNLP